MREEKSSMPTVVFGVYCVAVRVPSRSPPDPSPLPRGWTPRPRAAPCLLLLLASRAPRSRGVCHVPCAQAASACWRLAGKHLLPLTLEEVLVLYRMPLLFVAMLWLWGVNVALCKKSASRPPFILGRQSAPRTRA